MDWKKLWGKKEHTEENTNHDYSPRVVSEYYFNNNSRITEEQALTIPTFQACLNLISNTISQLDFKLIKHENRDNIEVEDDPRLRLLNISPNDEMSSVTFKRSLVKDFLLYGAGVVKIERDLNEIKSLYYLPSKDIETKVYVYDGYKRFSKTYLTNSYGTTEFDDYELMRVLRNSKNGYTGLGLLEENIPLLELAMKELEYSNDMFDNNAMPTGALIAPDKLTNEAFRRIKDSWRELYTGSKNVGKTVILEGGMEYKPLSLDPNNLQLSDMKKILTTEICKIFGVPESMINNSANKYNSNERNNIFFLQYCLSPIISSIEATVNKNLLLESEKNNYEFVIDTTNILRLTQSELVDLVSKEFNNGLISFNEARTKLNNSVVDDNEDYYSFNLGSVLYKYNQDKFIIPNTLDKKIVEGGEIDNGDTES